ncbi:MAG TPA: Stp1/IreP family PP2C-type Ser/Thr phosphatase [Clostridiales bacterium]|nr:Stp1/IreP family PP2C-type Ser/Thr phosphatase [Clostridiales bacterium]
MELGAGSHKGMVRKRNEDCFYIPKNDDSRRDDGLKRVLLVIADGMGGHNAGEVASSIAVDTVVQRMNNITLDAENIQDEIVNAISLANRNILEKSHQHEQYSGMGTTITMAVVLENVAYIGHMGDCRAYLIRDGEIKQLTDDHSLVEELVKNGSITEEEAVNHPQKHVITRALGIDEQIQVDIIVQELSCEDILILCTDGLINHISVEELLELAVRYDNMQRLVDTLIETVNARGGYDNVTVIAAKLTN